jgi:drug/metabolite transporter (DMT)-like permease
MSAKWVGFWVLGLIWGSSFLLIRIGVESVSPFQLVFMRTAIAAVGLNIVFFARGKRIPWKSALVPVLVLGLINITVPFGLITWGEQTVASGVASVLNSTVALFTLLVSTLIFRQERLTARKFIGLFVGFFGVVVLASRNFQGGELQTSSLIGQIAILIAAVFYAFGGSYSYRLAVRWNDAQMVAAGSMIFAALSAGALMLLAPVFGGPAPTPLAEIPANAMVSILALGLLNTFIAYMIYYFIVRALGAARASMVTYVAPVVGLTLGALVLNEIVDVRLVLGAALILGGIAIVTLRKSPQPAAATTVAATATQSE